MITNTTKIQKNPVIFLENLCCKHKFNQTPIGSSFKTIVTLCQTPLLAKAIC